MNKIYIINIRLYDLQNVLSKLNNENVEKCEQSKQVLQEFGRFIFIHTLMYIFLFTSTRFWRLKMYPELQ